ncbi:ARF guanine-nucleotide exchange factor GNOM-like [Rhododendron vialii]|uniref:ARF guanine-nucleotide exchange factor GNOM-like n=1 Tax=Rhododendron vialii TaxID=182163 RepID=UPI00265E446A|nr:ARF guanine-nucleotide exchange factor GNOM-like [Rhododendron vialii]
MPRPLAQQPEPFSIDVEAVRKVKQSLYRISCLDENWFSSCEIKRKLMVGVDHFKRDPKKGFEFLQRMQLLPEKLDKTGLGKSLVGDFLANLDEFCIRVLDEFVGLFDFQEMNLDAALRVFLETF